MTDLTVKEVSEAKEFNVLIPGQKWVGKIVTLEYTPDTVYLFQVPVPTQEMSADYREKARKVLKEVLPKDITGMIIGNDVNIYEIIGEDAVILRLKGEI